MSDENLHPVFQAALGPYMPASVNTDARRKASAAYHAKRAASGLRKVTLWLSPEAREALERLKDEHGSKDAAADLAIRKLGS